MSLLAGLTTDDTIQTEKDSVGGLSVLESDVYPMLIKQGYFTLAASGALAFNVDFESNKKEKLNATFYVTSGTEKGCKNFYINKKTKEKHYLPGFNTANALCLLTAGKEISTLVTEKKVINLYDSAQKKEVPTEVDMAMELLGKAIFVGVLNQLEDKRIKDTNTGQYVPTGETRNANEVDKVFRAKDKLTVVEIRAGKTEPEFMDKWLAKWKGVVKDKTTKTGITPGAPKKREVGAQAPTKSIFA